VVFLINFYNFFTGLFFVGIQGFPTGFWLLAETG
jgi:hypothetical protein